MYVKSRDVLPWLRLHASPTRHAGRENSSIRSSCLFSRFVISQGCCTCFPPSLILSSSMLVLSCEPQRRRRQIAVPCALSEISACRKLFVNLCQQTELFIHNLYTL